MPLDLTIRAESLPLRAPFRISRGVKTHAEVVVAELAQDGVRGRGECVPYARYAETTESVLGQLAEAADSLRAGASTAEALAALPPGAARNALDCADWDLEARRSGVAVSDRLGLAPPGPVVTAVTISLDAPEAMARAAAEARGARLLKVKLDRENPADRLRAVAAAGPQAKLILDPNESWTPQILIAMADLVASLPVALVEQPLPADDDAALEGLAYPAPICADEAAHTAADLPRLAGRYGAVNVKLDKAGGLTGALAMTRAARGLGLQVMVGCMVGSSLSIAPALHLAALADHVDLDGFWWLAHDRPGGCRFLDGQVQPPKPGFWG